VHDEKPCRPHADCACAAGTNDSRATRSTPYVGREVGGDMIDLNALDSMFWMSTRFGDEKSSFIIPHMTTWTQCPLPLCLAHALAKHGCAATSVPTSNENSYCRCCWVTCWWNLETQVTRTKFEPPSKPSPLVPRPSSLLSPPSSPASLNLQKHLVGSRAPLHSPILIWCAQAHRTTTKTRQHAQKTAYLGSFVGLSTMYRTMYGSPRSVVGKDNKNP